jgi:hypothetical protein
LITTSSLPNTTVRRSVLHDSCINGRNRSPDLVGVDRFPSTRAQSCRRHGCDFRNSHCGRNPALRFSSPIASGP